MRASAAASLGGVVALLLAGCTSPLTPSTQSNLPEIRATFGIHAYDSDGNNRTDGIQLTLLTAAPTSTLVGSDVVIERNGDSNVTVWRCPQRSADVCPDKSRGVLSWAPGETIYIRGLPGTDRLSIMVKERFVYNTTVQVASTRDTEVWAVLQADPYDSDGNSTNDGFSLTLADSDKAPFNVSELRVVTNKVDQPIYSDAHRTVDFTGNWQRGARIFVDGFRGDNHIEVWIKATRYDLGTKVLGE